MMKNLKHIFVVILILFFTFLIPTLLDERNPLFISTILLIVGFFIFNLSSRKSLFFKNYFTNKYNLLTTKFRHRKSFDISKDMMFEKLIEVINDSKFKLVDVDKENYEILAISPLTLQSWGENLYIDFESSGENTIMNFCSVTLFGIYSWGNNERNYNVLLNEIENSLIV